MHSVWHTIRLVAPFTRMPPLEPEWYCAIQQSAVQVTVRIGSYIHIPDGVRVTVRINNKCIAVRKVVTPLRELTCHMRSHSVTCHPAELTFPPLPQPKLVLD